VPPPATDRGRSPPAVRRLRAPLLIAALCGWLALPQAAPAAVLIEAQKAGQPVRLVVDRGRQRVLLRSGQTETLVDLAAGLIYLRAGQGAPARAHAYFRPGHQPPAPYRAELFGPGPMVAGNVSTYYVLYDQERVCAELMLSGWMRPFVDPAVRALALLEQLGGPPEGDACAAIPFTTYAAAGWPLLAGKIDRPSFVTARIAFDYRPASDELVPPPVSRAVAFEELAAWIAVPPS
jgi:hypothetical protein